MGIYIPGVSMPKDGECIVVYGDGEVWHHGKRIAKVGTALEVPPHGRLGDLDALNELLINLADNEYTPKVFASWLSYEENAPTIIPAEGGAEG